MSTSAPFRTRIAKSALVIDRQCWCLLPRRSFPALRTPSHLHDARAKADQPQR
jgi:hypothetical protein